MSEGEVGTSWMMTVKAVKTSSHASIQDFNVRMITQVLHGLCDIPLPLHPQTSQIRTTLSSPCALSSKFPQSVQNTKEPIAAIVFLQSDYCSRRRAE